MRAGGIIGALSGDDKVESSWCECGLEAEMRFEISNLRVKI